MSRVDHHSHILSSPIDQMILAARRMKIAEFSITEHVSQFKEPRETCDFGDMHPEGRIFSNLNEYLEEFQKLDDTDRSPKVNRGIEVDYAPRFEKRVGNFVNQEKWDILLCSVHELEDRKSIEYVGEEISDPQTAFARWSEYFRLQQKALESSFVPFNVLAHPVRMARRMKHLPPDMDEQLLSLATTARATGRKLELNGRDLKYAPEQVRRLAMACSKAGCMVSLGSDAHQPNEVFQQLENALKLVEEFRLQNPPTDRTR